MQFSVDYSFASFGEVELKSFEKTPFGFKTVIGADNCEGLYKIVSYTFGFAESNYPSEPKSEFEYGIAHIIDGNKIEIYKVFPTQMYFLNFSLTDLDGLEIKISWKIVSKIL